MKMSNKLFNKLKCNKCGTICESVYSNEELNKKYPFVEGDSSFKNLLYIKKWINLKRELKCPNCGKRKKISKKVLMKISTLNAKEKEK